MTDDYLFDKVHHLQRISNTTMDINQCKTLPLCSFAILKSVSWLIGEDLEQF